MATTRCKFIRQTAASPVRRIAASDKINFGLIGCKGMGWTNLKANALIKTNYHNGWKLPVW